MFEPTPEGECADVLARERAIENLRPGHWVRLQVAGESTATHPDGPGDAQIWAQVIATYDGTNLRTDKREIRFTAIDRDGDRYDLAGAPGTRVPRVTAVEAKGAGLFLPTGLVRA